MDLVIVATNRWNMIKEVVVIYAQKYGMIMESYALIEGVVMKEQLAMEAMIYVLKEVIGN